MEANNKPVHKYSRVRRAVTLGKYYATKSLRQPVKCLIYFWFVVAFLRTVVIALALFLYAMEVWHRKDFSFAHTYGTLLYALFLFFGCLLLDYKIHRIYTQLFKNPHSRFLNPVRPDVDNILPDADILVRASMPNLDAQKNVLLRASVKSSEDTPETLLRASLQGSVLKYDASFEPPVAEENWEALKQT